jgi:hypothetical protein
MLKTKPNSTLGYCTEGPASPPKDVSGCNRMQHDFPNCEDVALAQSGVIVYANY